jgi:DNA polymerase-3 subunit gamma/tau
MNENSEKRVLALKYRPKRFEDLIGQSTVSQTLSLALDSNRLSHAYLFSGLRGSGKTSTARIMAKALLCAQGPTSRPCEECEHCLSTNSNKHLDVIEMDAASNRGIDDIKDLIEHTKYKPSSARFKVFIIDEVHMLTPQAFNALLKTLEEPPGFVKFILATTDPLKLPATILSRTQHFRFKKISQKDVMHHLSHILHKEQIEFEKEALEVLSRSGQGSLRDTLTLLDQAIIFSKNKITLSTVTDMLGMIDPQFMDNIFKSVLHNEEINPIIEALEEYETAQVCDEMTIYLKQKMLEGDIRFDVLLYDRFFRIIADAKHLLSLNSNSSFVLILMLNKMKEATQLKTIEDIITEVESIAVKKPVVEQSIQAPMQPQSSVDEPQVSTNPQAAIEEEATIEQNIEPINEGKQKYQQLIDKVYERSYDLGVCFEKNFIFTSYENNILHITSHAQDEERKLLYKHFALIRSFVADVFGLQTQIEFNKVETEKKKDEITTHINDNEAHNDVASMIEDIELNDEQGGSGCVASMSDSGKESPSQKELQVKDILNSPMLNKVKELFYVEKITVRTKV